MESNITRDHIAMEAMKVLMYKIIKESTPFWYRLARFFGYGKVKTLIPDRKSISKLAYEFADAMIAEREKNKEE